MDGPESHLNTLPSGTLLDGKWRIEHVLGKGGTGVVYAAAHDRNGLKVALKILHADLAREESMRRRFLHEGYAANRVGHPGTVRVIDDGTTPDGTAYLVMERLAGKSLDAIADDAGGALPIEATMRYGLQWLEIIAAAHAQGIFHRDLKPENVHVSPEGAVKVLDFGLARIKELSNKQRLTVTGSTMGTPAFMPPEQALAYWDEVDSRSDVYSVGASLFTLMSGRLVHEGNTVPEIIVRVSTRPATPVQLMAPHIPGPIARVLDKALSFKREARQAHAGEMLADLRAAWAETQRTVPSATLAAVVRPMPADAAASSRHFGDPSSDYAAEAATTNVVVPGGSARTSSERRRRKQMLVLSILGASLVAFCGTALAFVLAARGKAPEAAASASGGESSVVTAAASAQPSVTVSVVTTSSDAAPPTSSLPSTSAAAAAKQPKTPKVKCVRDAYTRKCPCARCD